MTMTKGQLWTLTVFPVKKGISKVYYIRKFLAIINDEIVNIKVLCLDRCFYSNEVISFLQEENIPHIVPGRKHGNGFKRELKGNHSQ
ncbi:MAG: hypothetical protein WC593_13860 [Methanoregula sp.]